MNDSVGFFASKRIKQMIKSKADLRFYLAADKFALGKTYKRPKFNDAIWKFQIILRKIEFYQNNCEGIIEKIILKYYKYRKYNLGLCLGFDIDPYTFGPGLRLNHFGNIVVNQGAKIGMWCDIHQGVNIGSNRNVDGKLIAPVIGNNCWIGPGAKIFGEINIGSNVAIGANAVVNMSFGNCKTVAGVPAKIVKESGTEKLNVAASPGSMEKFFIANPQFAKYVTFNVDM